MVLVESSLNYTDTSAATALKVIYRSDPETTSLNVYSRGGFQSGSVG